MRAVQWDDNGVQLLDQTLLPHQQVYLFLDDYRQVIEAIVNMRVRGAPAIGVAGAYGVALAVRECMADAPSFGERLKEAASALSNARPTAVNLSWAVERVLGATQREDSTTPFERALQEAHSILAEDVAANHRIGEEGAALLKPGSQVLTHCNTGALATGGWGTALGVVRSAWVQKTLQQVYLTESRPLLQGARLTAWELVQEGIPATLIVDGAAGFLFQRTKIDAVVLGADRIAANGDVANKIGTFGLAVLAKEHGVPFYVAAPISTIDLRTPNGEAIPIEERSPEEVVSLGGNRVAANGIDVWNPSFDVTPASYISGIITERGVARAPFVDSLRSLVGEADG
ncbi:MAG: methylthioribose-1-phosphate isomerase [Chloroflexi bacterium]|nr:MAG: methylthioribose-1-phosphate isomerase [Chloroflexota bacterium]